MRIPVYGLRVVLAVLIAATSMAVASVSHAAPQASIVMDLRNGKVLRSRSADRRLHPASLTKMMTLYLAFEAVRDGRLRLDQKVRVSRRAARQPASKLYLRAGQRVTVRSLIRATAVKSANDAAMVLAEAIGGSKAAFGRMMTRKAKRLGMKNSVFKNPHGLTQAGHYSTARDMALLGRHLFFDFPQYYNIFKRKTDHAAGKRIWNTNRLLSTYAGADGIKTGYTRAAGYNLVATAKRGSKHVIAVQFGARSSSDRARKVAALLDIGFARAGTSARKIRPTVQRDREVVAVRAAPVPLRKGAKPITGLAAVSATLAPSQAEAATRPVKNARSSMAPRVAELPKPRGQTKRVVLADETRVAVVRVAKKPSKRRRVADRVDGIPLPRPRPQRLAAHDQSGWAAEIGPFDSERDALAELIGMADTPVMTSGTADFSIAQMTSRGKSLFALRMADLSQVEAALICGSLSDRGADCSVVNPRR